MTILTDTNFTAPRSDFALPMTSDRVLAQGLGFQLALLVPGAIAYFIDERVLAGVSVWSKPIKFEISLITLFATLILLLPLLEPTVRIGRAVRWAMGALTLFASLEISYIVVQAARGRASHFNNATPIEAIGYAFMGVGAVGIVVCCFVVGWQILRHGRRDAPEGLRLGAAIGLMLGAVLTLGVASLMSTGAVDGPGHWVGGVKSDANGLFLMGWSRTGGDLRVPHFFATHLMQALPIAGLLLDRFAPARIRIGILLASLAGVLVVAATFMQAIAGKPFL